jgi:nucleotide-binding universal stress UspA family protein
MFRHVVVGIDEDPGSRDALALARALLDKDGRLTLAHVHHGDPRMRTVSPELAATERTRARQLLETVRTEAGDDARLMWTGASSVGRGLHEIAEHDDADLLVVGSSEHSLFGRATLSAHTRDALNGAPCAVALAPAGYRERPGVVREIGAGYDGSPESEHAVVVARRLADELGAKVSAFEAIALPAHLIEGPEPADERIDRSLTLARERIAQLGVEPHAAYGHAAEELALYGASLDLLLLGSRGYGPIGRLFHGSTSQRVALTARCPLLVLARATTDGEAAIEAESTHDRTVLSAPGH